MSSLARNRARASNHVRRIGAGWRERSIQAGATALAEPAGPGCSALRAGLICGSSGACPPFADHDPEYHYADSKCGDCRGGYPQDWVELVCVGRVSYDFGPRPSLEMIGQQGGRRCNAETESHPIGSHPVRGTRYGVLLPSEGIPRAPLQHFRSTPGLSVKSPFTFPRFGSYA